MRGGFRLPSLAGRLVSCFVQVEYNANLVAEVVLVIGSRKRITEARQKVVDFRRTKRHDVVDRNIHAAAEGHRKRIGSRFRRKGTGTQSWYAEDLKGVRVDIAMGSSE